MTRRPRPAIGSRLSGLVAGVDALAEPAATTLPTDALTPGVFQPRTSFPEDRLEELARSIQEQGVLQPLLVRPLGAGAYEIVAGERRWRAARRAGLSSVPVLIRALNDHEARIAAAIENLQRQDLNVIEEVRAKLQVAAATLGVPEGEAVARMFALERHAEQQAPAIADLDRAFAALGRETWNSFIRNRAAVLNLPDDVQDAVRGGLDYRKALVVGRVEDAQRRRELLMMAQGGETVQNLRALVSPAPAAPQDSWAPLGKRLADRKTLASLDEAKRRKLDRLLRQVQALLGE
ncbi:ParB/RepB/Spo0J family partition protein [Deinococcus koreensis]|uniref:Chromosome partitioning protein ParB n=1 Tax=Deinococcus koreensis TaxID=2054903 RepID=A0A2K3USU0_9DEIO|nr:ParB/RepB/Spo0J family partition protein [Deinococcus koreensis]PNY79613.1 chromosome partitioning protein ParB [Deinococcus koreensis]